MPLLILLLGIPTAEIFIFLEVGGIIGTWPTIGTIIGTAVIGGFILRLQGIRTIARARQQLAANRIPVAEMAEGALLAVAAVLLLTPGFFTDALGTLLLLPVLRRRILRTVIRHVAKRHGVAGGAQGAEGRETRSEGNGAVIDGEYTRLEDDDNALPPRER